MARPRRRRVDPDDARGREAARRMLSPLCWAVLNAQVTVGRFSNSNSSSSSSSRPVEVGYGASTYVAVVLGSGTSSPASRRASRCIATASRMLRSASSRSAPAATQPGRSGEYAE